MTDGLTAKQLDDLAKKVGDIIKGDVDELEQEDLKLPEGLYIAIDADCPKCGNPERRARFDEHGAVFSCRKCPYLSRDRNA